MHTLTNAFHCKTADDHQGGENPDSNPNHAVNKDENDNAHPRPETAIEHCLHTARYLANEVRNPLTNIQLSLGMLESGIKDDDLRAYLEIIQRSTTKINELVNELLKQQEAIEAQAKNFPSTS